jgi:hypothetical protein
MPRWIKIALKTLAIIIGIIFIAFLGMAYYVNANKKSLLVSITTQLNKNLNGKLTIESMDPTILRGFPGVSISLKNVVIKDSLWANHKHTLLQAKDFNVSLNTLAVLRGAIEIKKIEITDATIYLYTDTNGYSNTSIFRKKKKPEATVNDDEESSAEVRQFSLNQVNFVLDNQKGNKLFQFNISDLRGKMDYPSTGWHADVTLKAIANSLAFNTKRGSFIEKQQLDGIFSVHYDENTEVVTVDPNDLKIGRDPFQIAAKFNLGKNPVEFSIDIVAKEIMWKNAAALLAPNIRKRLNLFNLKNPINVKCDIDGDMGGGGDPNINVVATIKDNELTTPGGLVQKVGFIGQYTNNFATGKGFNDENSAIKLFHFNGLYEGIPFTIDTAAIHNFKKPIATGIFKSEFDIAKLNNAIGDDLLHFTKGAAKVNLAYTADIINFKLTKPVVTGLIDIKNADVSYVPRKLKFVNTSISLNFTGPDLFINNIRLQSGKSIVLMDGSIQNFLNLYYSDPDKIILNWKIRSPQLYLGEFLGFLGSRTYVNRNKKKSSNTNVSRDLNAVFERSKVNMNVKVDKLHYGKFLATDAVADLLVSESGIKISNLNVKHGGGFLRLNGNVFQSRGRNMFSINTMVNNVNIRTFFYGFNNFGLKGFKSENLRGNLFSKIKMEGAISNKGSLLPNSLLGNIVFDLKKGALLNFDPLINVGKFAFPLRDLNNITFSNLNGNFDVKGEKITIHPMLINSSVLNMNIAGIYSMNKGTNIALDVPLRNPKKDEEILDVKEKRERRMKGIVLHLLATDGEDGKIKFKLNKNKGK